MGLLENKHIIITGAGSGIGLICGWACAPTPEPTFDRARERGTDDRIRHVNPTRRAGQPREITEMACFLLSDRASYVNGQAIPVDGGLSSSHPWIFPR